MKDITRSIWPPRVNTCACCGESYSVCSPVEVCLYLLENGWIDGIDDDERALRLRFDAWHMFFKEFPAEQVQNRMVCVDLDIPLMVDAGDYDRCFHLLVQNLMKLEGRSMRRIVSEMVTPKISER